jgi:hypothetical protein
MKEGCIKTPTGKPLNVPLLFSGDLERIEPNGFLCVAVATVHSTAAQSNNNSPTT